MILLSAPGPGIQHVFTDGSAIDPKKPFQLASSGCLNATPAGGDGPRSWILSDQRQGRALRIGERGSLASPTPYHGSPMGGLQVCSGWFATRAVHW